MQIDESEPDFMTAIPILEDPQYQFVLAGIVDFDTPKMVESIYYNICSRYVCYNCPLKQQLEYDEQIFDCGVWIFHRIYLYFKENNLHPEIFI
jgi:hypothetical protein